MAKASLLLPMTAGDFSGAGSVVYSFGACVLIVDPGGCCGDFDMVEDPRIPNRCENVQTAGLKEVEVSIGDYAKIKRNAIRSILRVKPQFVALVGSPVPSIIGMDLQMMAQEIEEELDIPVLDIEATGFLNYAQGIHLATKAIVERFGNEQAETLEGSVNILGLTPIDYEHEYAPIAARKAFESQRKRVLCDFCLGSTVADAAASTAAQRNIAVSQAGVLSARWMQDRYGIPFSAGCVICGEFVEASPLRQPADADGEPLLIVGDEVMSHSLGHWMLDQGYKRPIECATLFSGRKGIFADTVCLQSDFELLDLLKSRSYGAVIGDPLLTAFEPIAQLLFGAMPHPALTGPVYRHLMPRLDSREDLQAFLGL